MTAQPPPPRRIPALLRLVGLCAVLAAAGGAGAQIQGVESVEQIARLTGTEGSDSINPTWEADLRGTDLGYMMNLGARTFFVFGDSFSTDLPDQGWRWNTLAWSDDTTPTDGLRFDGWIMDRKGAARAILRDKRQSAIANIPTGGIGINGRLWLWYMAMARWDTGSDPCWRIHFSSLAVSDDQGRNFRILPDYQFPANSHFGIVSPALGDDDPALRDGFLYLWGTTGNRCGGLKLARVEPERLGERAAYRFFGGLAPDGAPRWVRSEFEAPLLLEDPIGEFSVMYNRWARHWILLHCQFNVEMDGQKTRRTQMVLRQAPAPWGPWSPPLAVIPAEPDPGPIYAPYTNPKFVEDEGRVIYFTLSKWIPYDVFWFRATFR